MSWLRNILGLGTLDELVTYVNKELNGTAEYSNYHSDICKLKAIFSNPAMMKVFALQCDLFSLGKIYVYKDDKEVKNDPYLSMIKKPNHFQYQSQFLWDVMFWNMVGNCYNYCESKIISDDNNMYVLQNDKIQFPTEMNSYQDKIILSKNEKNKIDNLKLDYTYCDGSTVKLNWSNIIHMPDLTNGAGNWFKGASRIDSLYKIISNSEASMDALNINIRYSGKFMVAGKADPAKTDFSNIPLSDPEKQDIETKINGRKSVHAVKSMIDIKRFVENIGALKLDEIGLSQYFLIGTSYGIPKDVLEAFNSGTFENQEKARGAFVSYCLQPKGNLFFESHADFFGYTELNKSIVIDWEYLPFMQVFAKERAETAKVQSETLLNYMRAGVTLVEINEILDTKFTELDYEGLKKIPNTKVI